MAEVGPFLSRSDRCAGRVLDYPVEQLQIRKPALVGGYLARYMTRFEHRWETCEVDG
jgi:hypothetical protein